MNKSEIIKILEETVGYLEKIINAATSFLSPYGKEQLNFKMQKGKL